MSAPGTHEADGCHVRFAAAEVKAHESEIQLKYSDDRIDVHLGFLQINRRYEIQLKIEDDLSEEIKSDPLQNLHLKMKSYSFTEGQGHNILLEFHAHKEKLVQEYITIQGCDDQNKELFLVLHARVLGKGKGTPALRNGIKRIKVDEDDDSDTASDWQGFD
ncbi:hypothetical protein ACJMK2_005615 [Sinanodonta woodiana]|uniref:Adipose-secreted signaling protein n=1 Tax=Sinanodonta woodiana TaxID=1069815 RepID=A0ABD3VTR4_SINWO